MSDPRQLSLGAPGMAPPQKKHFLSKSRFVAGARCHRLLWWQLHEPRAPDLEPDEALALRFRRGIRVGEVARGSVPGGTLVDPDRGKMPEKARTTRELMEQGVPAIYEASFFQDNLFVAVDVLARADDRWDLIEVKSAAGVKEHHLLDVAVQLCVAELAGLEVRRAELMHLNRDCTYPDLDDLFVRADITEEARELQPFVEEEIPRLRAMLSGSLPEVATGAQCTTPHECSFFERCHPEVPEHHVSELHNLRASRLAQLEAMGIERIADVPGDFPLGAVAARQRRAVRAGRMTVEPGLAEALEELGCPVAFLDFETVAPPIPAWPGCRSFGLVPVQLSCHVLGEDGHLEHYEHLADGAGDPRQGVAEALLQACRDATRIVVYSASMERQCIEALAEGVPRLARPLEALLPKLYDLLPVVRDHVYHPAFRGSLSLKAVLPALVPDLGYDDLPIADGQHASLVLEELLLGERAFAPRESAPSSDPEEMARLRLDLARYCALDTLGLVRIVERLRGLCGESGVG